MKTQFLLSIAAIVLVCSCGTGKQAIALDAPKEQQEPNTITDLQPEISLADYLRRFSGVMVRGNGADATVLIRTGGNSFTMSSEPMFLVNGMQFNSSFRELSQTIAVVDIKSVRVYKNPSETAMYGVRGANGVIDIRLK